MTSTVSRHALFCTEHRLANAGSQLPRHAVQCKAQTEGSSRPLQARCWSATSHSMDISNTSEPYGSSRRQRCTNTVNRRSRQSAACQAASTPPGEAAAPTNHGTALKHFLADQFLPIGLLAAMLLGYAWPLNSQPENAPDKLLGLAPPST